jgi:hypothetical protein
MTWFADLTPYTYDAHAVGGAPDPGALNVGWLDRGHSYPTGDTTPDFHRRLTRLCVEHAENKTRGWHHCAFCSREHPILMHEVAPPAGVGDAEIRVRHPDGVRFAAPNLVCHYVTAHRYLPPQPFIDAVLSDGRASDL